MENYVLSCCSTVDLTPQKLNEQNISWIGFPVVINGKVFRDDMFSSTLSADEYYENLKNGKVSTTSQINEQEYNEYFENLLNKFDTVIHVSMSSNLSGTFANAKRVAEQINLTKKGKRVFVIDSLCTCAGYGMFVQYLADKKDLGYTAKQLVEYAEKLKFTIRTEFFVTDLSFLLRSGRVSKTSALIGKVLKIYPILEINEEGKLILKKNVRGKNNTINEILNNMQLLNEMGLEYNKKCFVVHSNCPTDAQMLISSIEKRFKNLQGKVELYNIGPTTGSHTGPGTVGLFYLGKPKNC